MLKSIIVLIINFINSMYDITIIGSGPSSLLTLLYLVTHYGELNYVVISHKFKCFTRTYGVFLDQIEGSWIYDYLDKNKLFPHIIDVDVNCSIEKNNKTPTKLKYGVLDNKYLYNSILDIISIYNVDFISGNVTSTYKNSYYNTTLFKQKLNTYIINSKFIIEGTGKLKHIGIDRNKQYKTFKQYFVGLKIQSLYHHTIPNVMLLDWYNPIGYNNKSFSYIIPYNSNTLLIEETVLICDSDEVCKYELLHKKLISRIKEYDITVYKTLKFEIDNIPLNYNIPLNTSVTFGIGQAGNIINNLSGYTIGTNIYHIPEICETVIETNFNTKKVIDNYWCLKRRIINKINNIGLNMMNDLSHSELTEFHHYYFKHIVGTYNYRVCFLNCDSKEEFGWWKFMYSFKSYYHFPIKYWLKIGYYTLFS